MNKLVLAFAFLVATQLEVASEANPKSLYARCRPGVVVITTANALGFNLALGTAFAVSDGTKLVTNFHVIRGAAVVRIKTADDHEYDVKYLFGEDEAHDLAILECPVQLPQLPLSEETPSVGDVIFTIGNPRGFEGSFSEGLVSGLRELQGLSVYQISAAVSPGSSGGPVLNNKGAVIAVTTFGVSGGQNLNFAIPIQYAKRLLNSNSKRPIASLPGATSTDKTGRAEVRRLWNQGTKMLARKRVLEFVQENPNDPAALDFAGDVMFFSGEWDEAITLYERAIDLAPMSSYRQRWLWVALAHTHMKRYDEALNAFERLGPKSDHPANLLWQIYMTEAAAGRFESARSTARALMTARHDDEIKNLLRQTSNYSEQELVAFGRGALNVQLKQQLQNNSHSHIPE
jgi:serine protease Do